MEGIIQSPSRHDKQRILKNMRRCRDERLKIRCQIVLDLLEGDTVAKIARTLRVAETTLRRVRERFLTAGEAGLIDPREENGGRKLDEKCLSRLYQVWLVF